MIVVLNGPPRSGKSSIARELQESLDGTWMNVGVDVARAMTPPRAQPGIGLRPGEPDHAAAPLVPTLYAALWESVAAHARLGLDVVTDVGVHDAGIAADALRRLDGLPLVVVGVRCDPHVLAVRRRETGFDPSSEAIERWEAAHTTFAYDLEVDTSQRSPADCAASIRELVDRLRA